MQRLLSVATRRRTCTVGYHRVFVTGSSREVCNGHPETKIAAAETRVL